MSVNPGFSGQTFMAEMADKVVEIRIQLDAIGSQAYLEVDGGIAANTVSVMQKAGATAFVAGTAVFKHPQGIAAGIKALRECVS
jgi:ribulose-phosphate 3-epimerase